MTQDGQERIVRVARDKDHPYTVISNAVAQNDALSFAARGMLVYLLSKPDDWQTRMVDLERASPAGLHATRTIFAELKAAGHVEQRRERKASGRFVWTVWVHESPISQSAMSGQSTDGKTIDGKPIDGETIDGGTTNGKSDRTQERTDLSTIDRKPADGPSISGESADVLKTEGPSTEGQKKTPTPTGSVAPRARNGPDSGLESNRRGPASVALVAELVDHELSTAEERNVIQTMGISPDPGLVRHAHKLAQANAQLGHGAVTVGRICLHWDAAKAGYRPEGDRASPAIRRATGRGRTAGGP